MVWCECQPLASGSWGACHGSWGCPQEDGGEGLSLLHIPLLTMEWEHRARCHCVPFVGLLLSVHTRIRSRELAGPALTIVDSFNFSTFVLVIILHSCCPLVASGRPVDFATHTRKIEDGLISPPYMLGLMRASRGPMWVNCRTATLCGRGGKIFDKFFVMAFGE